MSRSKKRTRVLLMATSMRGGGSEHQVALLARHLPRDQFDVHLYLTHAEGELLAEIPPDVKTHSLAFEQGKSGWRKLADRWPGTILRRQAEEFAEIVQREGIDVVYDRAFHNTMIAGHPAIKNEMKARRVSTIVSPPDVALPMVEKRFVAAKRRLLADAYRRSDTVVAVSTAAADSAATYYGLPRDRIVVVANPVDVGRVRAVAGMPSADIGHESERGITPAAHGDRLRLVCVGRMTPEKGQADLIEAIGRLRGRWPDSGVPRLVVRFIGDGPDRESLERRWSEMADPDGSVDGHLVEFAGVISPALSEIARSNGLVLPSHFEGMPNVVLEAFALEVPVVATRSGGTTDLQTDSGQPTCFWAEPGDPESLAVALLAMAGNPDRRARHVVVAGDLIRERHGIEDAIGKIGRILHG
ncbi:glycosyltransferase involved in cell wall biosynthesis [Rhodopirellula rubra]|uniref:Glycosyltransferase involved in cell wall biosynthesis n=1 Tax=Aporhodopirellula rubra TaxID=980271 RepID=A0A7W5DYD0_9BACT|nr:glycosyltransferase [Aporhodopirellula rubra]MBB3205877.1 glycosyltransferase involved in cell wall biosynthesis [Aporhodopirellula rubra]